METLAPSHMEQPGLKASPGCATPIKPAVDKLAYRIVQLSNSLKAVIVSDPETDKAAASMDVHVGSMLDPPNVQGLAHFTEHMLFYASEKYPKEDEYSKFISDHGGHTNAFTSAEDTNYQFDVNHDALPEALDRFSQFFIHPLISADGVEREVKAVDSEHSKNINSDQWRAHQLNKHTCNPEHPMAKFFTGNAETLFTQPQAQGLDVRQEVVNFCDRHYSANLMRLALYGRESLDELEAMVRSAFSAVQNKQLPQPEFPPDVYTTENMGKLMKVVPVREGHVLELTWAVPPSEKLYRQAPLSYLSHLLGHEGAGSAFALLKARGWASALTAGESGSSLSCASFFYIRVDLTDAGQEHAAEVAGVLFHYLELLKAEGGISREIWDECRALQELRFNWRDKLSPYQYVTSLSMGLQHYDDEHLLLGMYHVPTEYDPASIRAALDAMTREHVRITWSSKDFDKPGVVDALTEREPYYGTRYSLGPVPDEWVAAWDASIQASELHLPAPNPFIPSDFSLRPAPPGAKQSDPPVLLAEDVRLRLWHKTELSFEAPKAVVNLDFQCPETYVSPENVVLTRMFTKLLVDYLNEVVYPAELAGLGYSVSNTLTGFHMSVWGYNHKLPTLLDMLLDKAAHFEVQSERFAVIKEQLTKEYANVMYQQPYQWAMYRSELVTHFKRWRIEEYSAVIRSVTPEQLTAFLPRLMRRCFLEALAVGNVAPEEAVGLVQGALKKLEEGWGSGPVLPGQEKDLRVVKLPDGACTLLEEAGPNPTDDNSAAMVMYQVGPDDLRRNSLGQLVVQLGKREAFHTLRTVEQLGYIVSMFGLQDLAVYNVALVLQSDKFSAQHMAQRVDAYIAQFMARLEALPQSELDDAIAELCKAKLEKPKRLGELAQRWWSEVYAGTHIFDRQAQEVAVLRTITKQELLAFAQAVVGDTSTHRKLAVLIKGSAELGRSAKGQDADTEAAPVAAEAPAAGAAAAAKPGAETTAAAEGAEPQLPPQQQAQQPSSVVQAAERVVVVDDVWRFKRACEVYATPVSAVLSKRQAPVVDRAQRAAGQADVPAKL